MKERGGECSRPGARHAKALRVKGAGGSETLKVTPPCFNIPKILGELYAFPRAVSTNSHKLADLEPQEPFPHRSGGRESESRC